MGTKKCNDCGCTDSHATDCSQYKKQKSCPSCSSSKIDILVIDQGGHSHWGNKCLECLTYFNDPVIGSSKEKFTFINDIKLETCNECGEKILPTKVIPNHVCKPKDVSNQEHYTAFPIQVMEFCLVNGLNWCQANVVKYICRYKKKDGIIDLWKAVDYLLVLINWKQTGEFLPPSELKYKITKKGKDWR